MAVRLDGKRRSTRPVVALVEIDGQNGVVHRMPPEVGDALTVAGACRDSFGGEGGIQVAKSQKKFALRADQIKPLAPNRGGCFATDMITVEGRKVGYMYREEPDNDVDSGWRFMSGFESPAYMDDAANHAVYDVNTIANYDPDIIPFLDAPIGASFERRKGTGPFVSIEDE